MKEFCKTKLKEIIQCCDDAWEEVDSPFLFGGKGGILLLLSLAEKKDLSKSMNIEKIAQCIIDDEISITDITFSNGLAGIYWLLQYMVNIDSIEPEDISAIPTQILKNTSVNLLKQGNFDYLHGALGCIYILLYTNKNKNEHTYYSEIISIFEEQIISSSTSYMIEDFDHKIGKKIAGQVNWGLSHGIPSIFKFLLKCVSHNIEVNIATNMLFVIFNYIRSNSNRRNTGYHFPYSSKLGVPINFNTRLAWCYGDLSLGLILYQGSVILKNCEMQKYALEILKDTTRRKTVDETMIYDAGICHGSAGVAHIFNKMWHYTKDELFKEATDYWIQRTLNYASHRDGIAGYKMYNPTKNMYTNSYGLLEGAAGIGLVLLSYLTGDFSWDYCLMIND